VAEPWRERAHQVGWVLLPLRAFLALVFLDGGISKIADPRFLDDASPLSMHASVTAIRSSSPIGGALGVVENHSAAFGVAMAVAELAVGIGLALGLFTRIAAAGGMLLALSLWLTVSWGASPWFTSADVVYLFALSPLLIAGAGWLSLDAWLDRMRTAHPQDDHTRRALLAGGTAIVGAMVLGVAALSRPSHRSRRQLQIDTALPSQPLTPVGDVPVGGAVQVTVRSADEPAWVLQLQAGAFTAFDARCPHQGCIVDFVSAADGFACPCHHSRFDPQGRRLDGPAPRGLTPIPVRVQDGDVRTR